MWRHRRTPVLCGTAYRCATDSADRSASASRVVKGMVGPQSLSDPVGTKAPHIAGRATPRGTKHTIDRSTVFDQWCHRSSTGLWMSKLGCTTCKMPRDMSEAEDSLQLQIIKGLNVFEIDGSASDVYQNISKSVSDVLQAFELDREGLVFCVRAGIIRQPPNQIQSTKFEVTNTAAVRNRAETVVERYKASSLPGMTLKTGYNIEEMNDEQLASLNLRRTGPRSAAAVTPAWLDASVTNVLYNLNFETVDVLLIEGLHTLYDGRPDEAVEKDLLEVFQWAESLAAKSTIQWYGVNSPCLAPPLPRVYPPLPADAMVPEKYKKPYSPPQTMNLYRIMEIAKKAGCGEEHHLRYISYPFNLTQSQALGVPLPYDRNHTLCTLAQQLGLTTLSHNPIEAPCLQDKTQRYHRFPMTNDLAQLRQNFFHVMEKIVLKEREVKPYYDRMIQAPPMQHLFVGSVYTVLQLQLSNLFQFDDWCTYDVLPCLRSALTRVREGSGRDIKDWANSYDMLVTDMIRFRQQMFQHRHGMKTIEIDQAIDRLSPTLRRCPIVTQKALNFASHGADVVLAGFHQSRYFHEATELNPLVAHRIPVEELRALCDTKDVSFCDYNPPHPYMLEPFPSTEANISGKRTGLRDLLLPVDPTRADWPDIPKRVEGTDTPEQQGSTAPGAQQVYPPVQGMFGYQGRVGTADIANYGYDSEAEAARILMEPKEKTGATAN